MTPSLQRLFSDPKIRNSIIAFILLLVIVLLVWLVVSLLKPATLNISPTNISLDDGVTISSDKVITYNGSSFVEISPADSTAKVIYTPQTRFPSVEGITYAPGSGMLLTFSGNILETPVFDYKLKQDLESNGDVQFNTDLTSDNYYTWFLDFKTNKLKFVLAQEIDSSLAYYNTDDSKFYFVNGDEYEGFTDFLSYDIKTNKMTRLSTDLDYTDVKSIDQCGDSTCIVGHKNSSVDTSVLSKISSKGKISEVKKIEGDILPTPDKMTFAYLTEPDNAPTEDDNSEHDEYGAGIVSYQKLNIDNISTGESQEYSGLYKSGGAIGMYDDHFYYMSGTDGTYQYLKRSTHDIDFNYDDSESDFAEGFININKVGANFALIADVDRNVYIVSKSKNIDVFNRASQDEVNKNVNTCAEKINDGISVRSEDDVTSAFDVDFEILVPDDDNFNSTIHNINTCLAENTENLIGYSYMFTGVSPLNGKITTE